MSSVHSKHAVVKNNYLFKTRGPYADILRHSLAAAPLGQGTHRLPTTVTGHWGTSNKFFSER